jgi:hypothetical protein
MVASPPGEGTGAESPSSGPLPTVGPPMSWPRAILIGLGVFVYFSVTTLWLPSKLVQLSSVASASQWVQNVTVTGSWFVALAIGFVGLRQAQARGWI